MHHLDRAQQRALAIGARHLLQLPLGGGGEEIDRLDALFNGVFRGR
jgi:hypothetical protein